MAERVGLMTVEEFVRLYDKEGPFELVNGERIALSPNVSEHGVITMQLVSALLDYQKTTHRSQVFTEMPFVLVEESDWVKGSRVPDLMVFLEDRLSAHKAATPDWGQKPFLLVPDIAVEIISPNDLYGDVDDKVKGYLDDGVRNVWVINPRRKNVTIYRPGRFEILTGEDTLRGGEILPGFSLALAELFA